MRKYLFIALLILLIPAWGYASDGGAQFWQQQFLDDSGDPYTGVKVYHYAAGTTDAKTVWTDEGKTTPAAQPVVGDSAGVVSFYADGDYKLVIKDTDEATLYTWDSIKITSDTATLWEGNFGESFPTCNSDNKWHFFARVCNDTDLTELGMCNGSSWQTVIDFTAVFTTEVQDVVDDTLNSNWGATSAFTNLVVTNNISSVGGGTSDEQCDVDADTIVVYNTAGGAKILNDLNLTIDNTVVDTNGRLNVTLTGDTWYSVWLVNGTSGTAAGIHKSAVLDTVLSSSFTGYDDYGAFLGWMRTDGTSDFYSLYQQGSYVRSNTGNITVNGAVASTDISAYVPTTAIRTSFVAVVNATAVLQIHPVTFTLGDGNSFFQSPQHGTLSVASYGECPVETSQTIFAGRSGAVSSNVYFHGWEYGRHD